MSKVRTLISIMKNNESIVPSLGDNGILNWMSDEKYLSLLFKSVMKEKLSFSNPLTFNEKLQWLKVYDRQDRYTGLVDKIEAKRIVGELIGKKYIVPLLEVWDHAEAINLEKLPNKVVLKCNHDQGSVMIIDNLDSINVEELRSYYSQRLKRSPYPGTREYPYKHIQRKVFAEKYLGERIIDYKFYCFNGEPRFLYCGQGLTDDHSLKIDFYDLDWNIMPFYRTDYHRLGSIPKPDCLEEMIEISKALSTDVPFVRIDLFQIEGSVYFSEFTLYPASGLMPFVPSEYDRIVGDYLKLPLRQHK